MKMMVSRKVLRSECLLEVVKILHCLACSRIPSERMCGVDIVVYIYALVAHVVTCHRAGCSARDTQAATHETLFRTFAFEDYL